MNIKKQRDQKNRKQKQTKYMRWFSGSFMISKKPKNYIKTQQQSLRRLRWNPIQVAPPECKSQTSENVGKIIELFMEVFWEIPFKIFSGKCWDFAEITIFTG